MDIKDFRTSPVLGILRDISFSSIEPLIEAVISAGATFIVTPIFVKEVSRYCVKEDIPHFPGALTPKEIYEAWEGGAEMVKVFPVNVFGPAYFKEINGPFKDIKLMAVGGVTVENAAEYFSQGASAVAFGASVFKRDLIEKKDFYAIKRHIKEYINITSQIINKTPSV